MNEQAIQDLILELLTMAVNLAEDLIKDGELGKDGKLDDVTSASEITKIETFEENMMLSKQKGLVMQTKDGEEFRISITKSK